MVVKVVEWRVIFGEEKNTNKPLRLLFSGSTSDFAYITKMIYGSDFTVVARGKMPLSLFLFLARRNYYKCDLLLFQYKRSSSVRLKESEYSLPLWVGTTVSLPLHVKSNSAKSDIRLIKKNGLQYRVANSLDCIDDFFVNYWVPTVKKRYPEKDVEKEREAWNACRCELLVVSDGEGDVAGMLIRYDDERPYIWRNGLKNGDLSLWNKGAIAATYYFAFEYLFSKGFDSVYLGLSRGFLSDGVFQYKRKWGGAIKGIDRYAFGLRVLDDSFAVRNFLMNNPFFSFYDDGFYATVFSDDVNCCDTEGHFCDGIDGVRVVDLNTMALYKEKRM